MNNTLWIGLVIAGLLIGGIIGGVWFSGTETVEVIKEVPVEVIVEAPALDNEKLDRVCELTDGCEFYEGGIGWLTALDNSEAREDFLEELEDITDIDEDDLDYNHDMKDWQVRAYSKQDKKDDNWEVKIFVKITSWDTADTDDKERDYLLVTSVLDEGDYDSMTVQQVTRGFEFA